MKSLLRAGLFVVPFALLFLGIRWLGGDEAKRWRDRVLPQCPGALVAVDEKDLIVIAADRDEGIAAAAEVRDFRRELVARHADVLGEPRFERMVIVIFPDAAAVQAYAGKNARMDSGATGKLHGYADPLHGAIFLPRDAIETLRHETVHWVMETARSPTGPQHSPWLSEGLAQLFETFDPRAPGPPRPRVFPVRDIDRLIHLDHKGFMGDEAHRNYAEALTLCAFLFAERPKELSEYVEAERKSADARPYVFRRIFKDDEEPFRRDLEAFVARR